ncbi:MAG: sigma-70 family RNA polymerase sigma factor [Bacteroidetes bacterium]|nr:sigma-70 family RNA polymerase sigma factor [Bacteroidota bacterium]
MVETIVLEPRSWVSAHADYLYNYAFARLDHEEQARDLVQETFLAALERLDQFKGRSSERTWLTAILKFKIIDVYRKRNSGLQTERVDREPEQEFFEADNGHWKEEYSPRPLGAGREDALGVEDSDPLADKELTSILQRCLQKLPALWYSVFTMKHMEEEATDKILQELKLTSSNFWVIIHRAKLNLRACIQKAWL